MRSTHSTRYPRHYTRTALTMTAAAALFGCSEPPSAPDKSGTFFGPVLTLAAGTARSYVILDRFGAPEELGVALSETALVGLPSTAAAFLFTLPPEASATPYDHVVVNWQSAGHGAPGTVYTIPHFDAHFYTVTQTERQAMVLGDAQLAAKMVRAPAAEFVPAGYIPGVAIQQMGLHWLDPAAPERLGQPFTKTMIYGSYDGAMIFTEPMVTKAYLETKPAKVVTPIKLPAQYSARGYQATSYTVDYDADAKEYRIAISGLVER